MKFLVTGIAGFIGYHVARRLVEQGHAVTGIDNLSAPSDLKLMRLSELGFAQNQFGYGLMHQSAKFGNLKFVALNIQDRVQIHNLFAAEQFDKVINLAAKTGVRSSLDSHSEYIASNIDGFSCILENCVTHHISHFIYASSSSVYGNNEKVPFSEDDALANPASVYAVTKIANELLAKTYSNTYGLKSTGLRFFTVYGPWGRTDMAPMLFAKAIADGKPINVFNNGNLLRDFTYIDDIVNGVCLVANMQPQDISSPNVYNIGCSTPVKLLNFISELELAMGQKAEMNMMPMQVGDVYQTYADTTAFERDFGYRPKTSLKDGIAIFVKWFLEYNNKLV
ncbi:MAG: NAD-dependent epimerase/dehydratase family protein [Salinivirgaceae bacterium]|nr:NAD-dependent epimerase/dehydratase family protein [Salinivirgaceae bacterium]